MASPSLEKILQDAGCLIFCEKIEELGFSDKLSSTMPSQGRGDYYAQFIKISFTNVKI